MKKLLFLVGIALMTNSCALLGAAAVALPAGVVDCGLKGISELAVTIIDDVNTCIAEGKQDRCNQPQPSDVTKTSCGWKRCLWDKARPQGKQYGTEALLCAVEQSGVDFGATAATTGDAAPRAAEGRAREFIVETKVQFAHQAMPSKSP